MSLWRYFIFFSICNFFLVIFYFEILDLQKSSRTGQNSSISSLDLPDVKFLLCLLYHSLSICVCVCVSVCMTQVIYAVFFSESPK